MSALTAGIENAADEAAEDHLAQVPGAQQPEVTGPSFTSGIHEAYPWILLICYSITIGNIIHDYEMSEESWRTTNHFDTARKESQDTETAFASISLFLAALGGFLGWYYDHRDFLMLAFITNMSLASTMKVDNWLIWEVGTFRFFSAASGLLAAWASLVKSNDIQQRRRKRVQSSDAVDELFSRAALVKLSLASLFFVFGFGLIKLIFYHFTDKVAGDNKYDQLIYDDSRHGAFMVLTAVIGYAGVTQINRSGRLLVLLSASMCFVYVQMSNSLMVYFGFSTASIRFICDCEIMSIPLDCPKVLEDHEFELAAMYFCWISTMAAGYFLYLLSERVQGGAGPASGGDTQAAWYGKGDHRLARNRDSFAQAIGLLHTAWFGILSMTIVFAVVLKEVHTRNGEGCTDATLYSIEAVVFGITAVFLGLTNHYATERSGGDKALYSHKRFGAAALVGLLFSASLLNHQISGARTRATYGSPIHDDANTGPISCPPFSPADFATCFGGDKPADTAASGDSGDGTESRRQQGYSATEAPGETTAAEAAGSQSELCAAVFEYARRNPISGSRNVGETFIKYDPPIEDMWHAVSVSHWLGLVFATFGVFALFGLNEANEDYTTEFGTVDDRKLSVIASRGDGSVVEYSAEIEAPVATAASVTAV